MSTDYTDEDVESVARVICTSWMDPDKELTTGKAWKYYDDIAHEVLQSLADRGRILPPGVFVGAEAGRQIHQAETRNKGRSQ